MDLIWKRDYKTPKKPTENYKKKILRYKEVYHGGHQFSFLYEHYKIIALKFYIQEWKNYFKYKIFYKYWKYEKEKTIWFERTKRFSFEKPRNIKIL